MTIITGSQFRANQGKYIGLAHSGERVILSSKYGYAELKPVDAEDKEVQNHNSSTSLRTAASKARREHEEGKTFRCETIEELHSFLDSL